MSELRPEKESVERLGEGPPLRVWPDDVRRPPGSGWAWVKTVEEAIDCLKSNVVTEISLDNDLHPFEHDGFEVCEWMAEHCV